MLYFFLFFIFFIRPRSLDASCEAKRRAIEEEDAPGNIYSFCLEDPCNPSNPIPVNNSNPCPKWCKKVKGNCHSKQLDLPPPQKDNMASVLLTLAQMESKNSDNNSKDQRLLKIKGISNPPSLFPSQYLNDVTVDPQNLDLFSSILMGYGYDRFEFPHNCKINIHDQINAAQLIQPPLNIPYCVRIACNPSDPSLEFDSLRCLSNPGCYFDHELAFRRQGVSAALAGVPICHLAIRNRNFQRLANEYIQRTNRQWNALYTNCLIEQNLVAIEHPDPGCYALKYLHRMHGYPKIAGWKSINRRNCFLINGCWLPSIDIDYHCFYPADVDDIEVFNNYSFSSRHPSQYEVYGRPICRPFNDATPQGYLESYHQCKLAGCAIDSSITTQSLYDKFASVLYSDEVPENLRYSFWLGVQKGSITPGNYQEKLMEMKRYRSCPRLSSLLAIPDLGQLDAIDFSNRYFDTVIRPLKQNLFNSKFLGSVSSQLTPLHCLLYASQAAGRNVSPLVKQLFDNFCSTFSKAHYACPYSPTNINLTGYPALTGSVEGCCEKHLCYTSRHLIQTQRSGVASFYSEWGEWGTCSASCGGGLKKRKRNCEKHPHVLDAACHGISEESQPCNVYPCPYWKSWGEFGSCSVTCGDGFKLRSRKCVDSQPSTTSCVGNAEEKSPCNIRPCPIFGKWVEMSECPCSAPRIKYRRRTCVDHCNGVDTELGKVPCTRFCGRLECQAEKSCFYPACRRRFKCVCKPEGFLCSDEEPNPERCFDGLCRFF